MLELRKKAFFSLTYLAVRGGVPVGTLEHSLLGANARIHVGGRRLDIRQRGFLRDSFVLLDGARTLVELVQDTILESTLEWRSDGHVYAMARTSFLDPTLRVTRDGTSVGKIRARSGWWGGATATLPDEVPLELQIFLAWTALARRQGRTIATTS